MASRRRYLVWTIVSQAVNAGTNLLLTLQLAHGLSARDFAVVSLALAVLILVMAGLRGAVFEPAVVHGDLTWTSSSAVARVSAVAGAASAAGIVGLVWSLDGPLALAVVLALGAFATTVQDGARWLLFGLRQERRAAYTDLLWLGVQISVLVASFASGSGSRPISNAAGWTAGALIGGVCGWSWIARCSPSGRGNRSRRVWQWGLEYVIAAGTLPLAILVAPLTGGVELAGGLRGAASLLGAATVVLGGAQQAVVARLRHVSDRVALRHLGVRLGGVLGGFIVAACLPLLMISDRLGERLLGETWPATRALLPVLIVQRVAAAVAAGPAFVLRKEVGQTSGVWWRAAIAAVVLVGVAAGAASGSEVRTAVPLAAGSLITIPIWYWLLIRATTSSAERFASPEAPRVVVSAPTTHDEIVQ